MAPIKSYFNIMSDEFDSTSLDPNDESGSFIIATVFFMFVFLMAASFGVDVTNYYNKRSKLQNIADGAALSTGRALQQYTDYPNTDKSIEAYQNYVRERQGKQKLETYASGQEQLENNLMVKRWETNCSKSSGPYVYYDDDGDSHDLPDPHNNCYGSNSDTFYVTGVTVFDHFEPYFLPESAFGQRSKGMSAHAVAVIEPKTRVKTIQSGGSAQCGLYVKQSMKISGNNFNAGVSPSLEVCGSATGASIDVDGNNNELGDVHLGNCSNLEVERHNSVGPC
ncbi:MAG: pilus assembly protein TadG-related protein, partial [bacterium]